MSERGSEYNKTHTHTMEMKVGMSEREIGSEYNKPHTHMHTHHGDERKDE